MRLGGTSADTRAALDACLSRSSAAPIVIGFSGGGDSLALLLEAHDWARAAGRALIAATVDHRLRPEGADWARWCADRCAGLGVAHATLVWEGAKPTTGLSAAARRARHTLLARFARAEGARVILLAHTADDRAEAAAMRAHGASTPDPHLWTPSPVWPDGRGVFLLRPLLGRRRAELRDTLVRRGETWIEDPANTDPDSLRARARAGSPPVDEEASLATLPPLETAARPLPGGALVLAVDIGSEVFARAMVCAGGGARLPRRVQVDAALAVVRAGRSAVLAGAAAHPLAREILITRDPGAYRRRGAAAVVNGVWDGRIAVADGLTPRPAAGARRRLRQDDRQVLAALPAPARAMIPVIEADDGPRLLAGDDLVWPRFLSACGVARDEAEADGIWMKRGVGQRGGGGDAA
jgi:tRNA(Ile)-lysidine synthase